MFKKCREYATSHRCMLCPNGYNQREKLENNIKISDKGEGAKGKKFREMEITTCYYSQSRFLKNILLDFIYFAYAPFSLFLLFLWVKFSKI